MRKILCFGGDKVGTMKTRTIELATTRSSRKTRPARASTETRTKNRGSTPDIALRVLLVPVDFSAGSMKALDFALALAKPFGASVELLHVLDPMHAIGKLKAPKLDQLRREAVNDAKRRLANLARRNGNGRLRHAVLNGSPYAEIVEKAARIKANMIVMGSRGRTGLGRILVGSVAEKVVRHAPCPVLSYLPTDEAASVHGRSRDEVEHSLP